MKKTISIYTLTLFSITTFAQLMDDGMNYDKGKKLYDDGNYKGAVNKFLDAYESNSKNEDVLYYLGLSYSYLDNRNDSASIQYFEELKQLNPDYWAWFYYALGDAHLNINNYEKAKNNFRLFLEKFSTKADKTIYHHKAHYKLKYAEQCENVRSKMVSDLPEPINLGENINSSFGDFMPSTDPTGKRIYFTSKRKGGFDSESAGDKEGDDDLYFTDKVNDNWQKPVLLPAPLNSANNEGAPSLSADGQTMIFVGCNWDGGIGSCDLYSSDLEGNKWSTPKNLGNIVNSKEWDSQPSISSDGKTILFCSSRTGGYGGEDIYMIEKTAFGDWGPAQNLGNVINTPFPDKSPYLSPDGKTLYFASKGHPGFGDFDLFKSVKANGKWSEPINLGSPINTDKQDVYFTIGGSGEVGYLASARGKNDLDLYEVQIPEAMRPQPTVIVSGKVTDNKTKQALGAMVLVEDLETGELIATNKSNSVTGKYLVVLPIGKNYGVSASQEGYFFYSNNFKVPKNAKYEEITKDIALKPIEKGAKVVMNNIFFETGKATLENESFVELNKVVTLLKNNPKMQIEIGGHTDNVGDGSFNVQLSHNRSKSVVDYLTKAGIALERLKAKGYGETEPVAPNNTKEGKQLNRRVEFIVNEM